MSLLSNLSKCSVFDSFDEILLLIKQFAEETHVYFRLDKPIKTVQFWNKSVKSEDKKVDEKFKYKEMTYWCPHSCKVTKREHGGKKRPDQNVMFCDCEAHIHFRFNLYKQKFEIVNMILEHKNHPVSEVHYETYARKR